MSPPSSARSLASLTALVAGLTAACSSAPVVPPNATKTWPEMTGDERAAHMHEVVAPAMRTAFQAHDAQRFADFGCKTCHGPGEQDGTFAMPNPALPYLDASLVYRKHRKATPEITKFMWKTVEPRMGELMGLPHGDRGVHCFTCHVVKD